MTHFPLTLTLASAICTFSSFRGKFCVKSAESGDTNRLVRPRSKSPSDRVSRNHFLLHFLAFVRSRSINPLTERISSLPTTSHSIGFVRYTATRTCAASSRGFAKGPRFATPRFFSRMALASDYPETRQEDRLLPTGRDLTAMHPVDSSDFSAFRIVDPFDFSTHSH